MMRNAGKDFAERSTLLPKKLSAITWTVPMADQPAISTSYFNAGNKKLGDQSTGNRKFSLHI
jgi:hypothetical protein